MSNEIEKEDLYLLRCIVTKVTNEYFEGKDYNGKKYLIAKNNATKNFKVGTDSTFYATKKEQGLFFKKVVLHPITNKEYETLVTKRGALKIV